MAQATAEVKSEPKLATVKDRQFAVIRFPKSNKKTDPPIVSVGVNGDKIRCKRNEIVPVKAAHIHALRNAKEPVVEEDDGSGSLLMVRRRKVVDFAPRFPFELLGWIDEATYQEFRKRTTGGESLTEAEVLERIG